MTADELHQVLIKAGIAGTVIVTAEAYALPTRAWVLGAFDAALREATGQWKLGKNDCRIMATRAKFVANECHLQTRGNDGKALAVGEIFFWPDGKDIGHVVPAFIVNDLGKRHLLCFEPQNGGSKRKLSESEIASCYVAAF